MKKLNPKLKNFINSIKYNINRIIDIYGENLEQEIYEIAFKHFWEKDPNLYLFSFLSENSNNRLQVCTNFSNALILFDKRIDTIKINKRKDYSYTIIYIPLKRKN